MLLGPSEGWGPGMLLNIPQGTGRPPRQRTIWPNTVTLPKLTSPQCLCIKTNEMWKQTNDESKPRETS